MRPTAKTKNSIFRQTRMSCGTVEKLGSEFPTAYKISIAWTVCPDVFNMMGRLRCKEPQQSFQQSRLVASVAPCCFAVNTEETMLETPIIGSKCNLRSAIQLGLVLLLVGHLLRHHWGQQQLHQIHLPPQEFHSEPTVGFTARRANFVIVIPNRQNRKICNIRIFPLPLFRCNSLTPSRLLLRCSWIQCFAFRPSCCTLLVPCCACVLCVFQPI